jgi:tRNA pseudouridine32 synthase / 23S rRNA pseudouridine746 synthase
VTPGIPVIYDDGGLVAVCKPPGLPVVPGGTGHPGECVRAVLERQLGARLWVVHRLDRDTSGVLLFARTAEAHRALCLVFEERQVRKTYVAFTFGVPDPREGRIETPLHPARRGKVRPALPGEGGAWQAVTRYTVRKRWERDGAAVAMVETHPETGRHHQIRAHLRSIGTPVLFDRFYGGGSSALEGSGAPVARLALHASRLVVPDAFRADATHEFEAALPADLTALLHWLDAEWTVVPGAATSSPG